MSTVFDKQSESIEQLHPAEPLHITPQDIETAATRISKNKAPGADGLRDNQLRLITKHKPSLGNFPKCSPTGNIAGVSPNI